MPISALGTHWPAVKRLIECKPKTVLELGVGTGRYGVAIRDFVDYLCWGADPTRPETWHVFLEGVEIHKPYFKSPLYDHYYDRTHNEDARDFLKAVVQARRSWDVVLCMDMIEHVPETDAIQAINRMLTCADQYVVIATPYGKHLQETVLGNEHERHQFTLHEDFFDRWGDRLEQLWKVDNCLLAVLKGKNPQGKPAPESKVFEVESMLGVSAKQA